MARLKKNDANWHRVTIRASRPGADMILMGSGRHVQLSIWTDKGDFAYFTGEKALQTLARAILKRSSVGKSEQR